MSEVKANNCYLYFVVFTGNLVTFAMGMSLTWTSPVLPRLTICGPENPLDEAATTEQISWIGSLYALGAMLGALGSGYLTHIIGRKKCIISGGILLAACFIILGYATTIVLYYVCRFFLGFASGAIFTVIPMYNGEISEIKVRGRVCSTLTTCETAGEFLTYCIGPYLSIFWFCITCGCIAGVASLLCFFILPESPYYFVYVKDYAAAEKSLIILRRATKEQVKNELELLKSFVEEAHNNKANLLDLVKIKASRKALVITWGIILFQHFSGVVPILLYAEIIFFESGTSWRPEICAMTLGGVEFLSSFIAPTIVDTFGSKDLLLVSAVGMAIAEYPLGVYFLLQKMGKDVDGLFWLPVFCLMLYILTYTVGFGPVTWTIMGEIFPANVKSLAFSITACYFWFMVFILSRYFFFVIELVGPAISFFAFATICVVAILFILIFVIDTKGKTFQEIQDTLNA